MAATCRCASTLCAPGAGNYAPNAEDTPLVAWLKKHQIGEWSDVPLLLKDNEQGDRNADAAAVIDAVDVKTYNKNDLDD